MQKLQNKEGNFQNRFKIVLFFLIKIIGSKIRNIFFDS